MSALTTTDVATGWLMVAAALIFLGALVIWFVGSELAEQRAERAHQAEVRRRLSLLPSDAYERHVAESLRLVERVAVSNVIPMQREGR